jgi:hypothetical protein
MEGVVGRGCEELRVQQLLQRSEGKAAESARAL